MFAIELRSKEGVKGISLDGDEKVFIEGSLGTLQRARFLEGLVLEIIGSGGELRVDLAENDLILQPPGAGGPKHDRGNRK
jgi:hypothetical protein